MLDKEIQSKLAGKIVAKTGIELIDAIIVATAFKCNLPLATLNMKDFGKVKGLKLVDLKKFNTP